MKRVFSFILAFVMLFSIFSCVDFSAFATNTQQIHTAEEFYNIRNNLSGQYTLMANIDLSRYENWEPIGNYDNPFTGTLSGNGFSVSNVHIYCTTPSDIGLFGSVLGGTIEDLDVYGDYAAETPDNEGDYVFMNVCGIAGGAHNAIIRRCSFFGSVSCKVGSRTYSRAGGIATAVSSTITDCLCEANVYAYSKAVNVMAAGICVWTDDVHVSNCLFKGNVVAETDQGYCYVGGINASGGGSLEHNVVISDTISGTTNGFFSIVYQNEIGNFADLNNNIRLFPNDAACMQKSTYTALGWDFNNTWSIQNSTPFLSRQQNNIGIIIPEGYDFSKDRYHFRNFSEEIELKYYTELFGKIKGEALQKDVPDLGQHGLCFGMAVSTMATLINAPSVTDYFSWMGLPYSNLNSVKLGSSNIDLGMTAKEYIKCCFLYQKSVDIVTQRNTASHIGIRNVYNAVKKGATESDKITGIAIDFWGGPGGHTVYACGIDGNDILIDDSNSSKQTKIVVNGDEWSYSGGGFNWSSSSGCTIDYVDSYIIPYLSIVAGAEPNGIYLSDGTIVTGYSEITEEDGSFNLWNNKIYTNLDNNNCLAIIPETFNIDNPDDLLEIKETGGSGNGFSTAYWLKEGLDTLSVENTENKEDIVKFADNDLEIVTTVPSSSKADISMGDKDTVMINCEKGDSLEVLFISENEEGILTTLAVSGQANDDDFKATYQDNGIKMEGLSSGNISVLTDDEILETLDFQEDDKYVDISYDSSQENNSLMISSSDDPTHIHKFELTSTVSATCTEDGEKTYTCNKCGKTITKLIEKLNHNYKSEIIKPTCTEAGYTAYTCSRCGDKYKGNEVAALGHNFVNTKIVKPTTVKVGYNDQKCSVCGTARRVCTAPTGKVKTVKCKARTASAETMIWSAIKGVQGYQIQISTKDGKKWDKTYNAKTKTSYTFKKLSAGGTYKFRVRIYAKGVDGKYYFGAWTKALTSPTLPTGTTLTKLTPAKKAFTAQWKKNAAVTGYQVQYSLKSNFSGAKTITVKSPKTLKAVAKKLNAGKYYYVRIRTYKTISKVNYFSTWSKTYKVKSK